MREGGREGETGGRVRRAGRGEGKESEAERERE